MSLTHSNSRKKTRVVGGSEQGAARDISQRQTTWDLGGSCKKPGSYPKCSGEPLEGFKQEKERSAVHY